jgi:predicted nucleic acid-binding protein
MWEEGMFVVDTNVLLPLYRYSRSTRDELLRVLRALENKHFLPHQVGREFLERRLEIVRKQREGFSNLRQRVTGVRREMETELRKVLRLRPGEDLPD